MSAGPARLRRVIRRSVALVPLLAAFCYGAVVAAAHYHPPLALCGGAANQSGETYLVGKGLCNNGAWAVSVEEVTVQNPEADVFIVMTVREGTGILLPESVAVDPRGSAYAPFDPDRGLLIEPARPDSDALHGLRVETRREFVGEQVLVIRYRYLGWPMVLRTSLD